METSSRQIVNIPSGVAGTKATLKAMRKIVGKYKSYLPIRNLAIYIARNIRNKDFYGEARAVHAYVRDNIRYIRDVHNLETLSSPIVTISIGAGDCDDMSIVVASLLESIGAKTRFVALGFGAGLCHVITQVYIAGNWIASDPTMPWPFGRMPKNIMSSMVMG